VFYYLLAQHPVKKTTYVNVQKHIPVAVVLQPVIIQHTHIGKTGKEPKTVVMKMLIQEPIFLGIIALTAKFNNMPNQNKL
jgi:hypothetical protein